MQTAPGIAVGSTIGPARRENQDRLVAAKISSADHPSPIFLGLICDGMGGMNDGGGAATLAASTFLTEFALSTDHIRTRLYEAVMSANKEVYRRHHGKGGTTLTAFALAHRQNGFVAHVGDTRLYLSSKQSLSLITTDDTVEGVVRARSHHIDEDSLDSQLIQFIGIGDDLDPHIFPLPDEQWLSQSEVTWLLTSDGAHGLGRNILRRVCETSSSATDLVRKLMFVADAVGVNDNASAVAITPRDISLDGEIEAGTSITVWTPSDFLEIWIMKESPEVAGHSTRDDKNFSQKPEVLPSKAKRKPKKLAKKPSQNRAPSKTVEKEGQKKEKREEGKMLPQLNITFGDNERDD